MLLLGTSVVGKWEWGWIVVRAYRARPPGTGVERVHASDEI